LVLDIIPEFFKNNCVGVGEIDIDRFPDKVTKLIEQVFTRKDLSLEPPLALNTIRIGHLSPALIVTIFNQ
jgi:hypothetical protein